MENIFTLFVALIILSVISQLLSNKKLKINKKKISVPWPLTSNRLNDKFISPAELHFYQCLQKAAEGLAIICPKVSLQDIFAVDGVLQKIKWGLQQKIYKKHVDFLLCEPEKLLPVVAIELDDRSHEEVGRTKGDKFVNRLFNSAHVPLLRFPVKNEYDVNEIKNSIRQAFGPDNSPMCPDCDMPLLLKTNYKNKNYWGCRNYPNCKQSEDFANIPIEKREPEQMEPLTDIKIKQDEDATAVDYLILEKPKNC